MASVKELQKIISNATAELTGAMRDELTKIVAKYGNVMNFDTPLNVNYDNSMVRLHSLLNVCNLDPDLIIVRKINACANFNVIRFMDLSSSQQSAIYNAVKRFTEKPVAPDDKTPYVFKNIPYGNFCGLYKSSTTGDYLLLTPNYEVDPNTGEVGSLTLLKVGATSSMMLTYAPVKKVNASFMQVFDENGEVESVSLALIEYNGEVYNCRYAINADGIDVVVAPSSLHDAMIEVHGDVDSEIDNEISYYIDDNAIKTLGSRDFQNALHKESPDYFPPYPTMD